jgi:hypothetical protein
MWYLIGRKYHAITYRSFYVPTTHITKCGRITHGGSWASSRERPRIKDRCKKCEKALRAKERK